MQQASVHALNELVWFTPVDDDELEVAICPAGVSELQGLYAGMNVDLALRRICTRAFVDFKGYIAADGSPVKNTLQARMELFYAVKNVREAIVLRLHKDSELAQEGEGVAGSD